MTAIRKIVLAGGGHSHALLLHRWARRTCPSDVQLTLVSPDVLTPYSGMLPGYIAGHYTHAAMHIDLARLCDRAGARFIQDCVADIDINGKTASMATHAPLPFDILSLDIGAAPDCSVAGAALYARPVKPIAGFIRHWAQVLASLRAGSRRKRITVVGGGAGSVEVVLAMAHAVRADAGIACKPRFTLVTRNTDILPDYPERVVAAARHHCCQLDVVILTKWQATEVKPDLLLGSNKTGRAELEFDHLFWCAGAGAPAWLRHSGLALSPDGFVRVNACLQSVDTESVFAAGDIAHFEPQALPRAGVYAVRQAAILDANLRHLLKNEAYEAFSPQQRYLSLLALGEKFAAGKRGRLQFSGRWAWHWKNWLDQRFMKQFR